jgi:hypothetical protein
MLPPGAFYNAGGWDQARSRDWRRAEDQEKGSGHRSRYERMFGIVLDSSDPRAVGLGPPTSLPATWHSVS